MARLPKLPRFYTRLKREQKSAAISKQPNFFRPSRRSYIVLALRRLKNFFQRNLSKFGTFLRQNARTHDAKKLGNDKSDISFDD